MLLYTDFFIPFPVFRFWSVLDDAIDECDLSLMLPCLVSVARAGCGLATNDVFSTNSCVNLRRKKWPDKGVRLGKALWSSLNVCMISSRSDGNLSNWVFKLSYMSSKLSGWMVSIMTVTWSDTEFERSSMAPTRYAKLRASDDLAKSLNRISFWMYLAITTT